MVVGSDLYHVVVRIRKLGQAAWKAIRVECAGRVGSVLELLQGRLSDHVTARRHRSRPRPVPETRRDYPHLRLSRLGGDVQARGRRALRRRQPARRASRAALPPAGRRRRRPGRRRHGVAGRRGGGRRPRRRSRGHLRHRSRPGGQRRGGRPAEVPPDAAGPAAGGRVGPAPRRPGSSLRAAGWRSCATRADSRSPSSPACSAYPRRRCTAGKRPAGRSPSEPVRRTPCRCCTWKSRNARLSDPARSWPERRGRRAVRPREGSRSGRGVGPAICWALLPPVGRLDSRSATWNSSSKARRRQLVSSSARRQRCRGRRRRLPST